MQTSPSNKRLYLLDDTRYDKKGSQQELAKYREEVAKLAHFCSTSVFRRQWRGAKAGIMNDFLATLGGRGNDCFELVAAPGVLPLGEEKYLIVFDADMNPFPDFVEPLVASIEADSQLAFVKTPQYYTNFENNRVARASGLQQAVFYEYICEGKSLKNAMFCCGTNVMFRISALQDVGGFREDSVTEDFATSFQFHQRGWGSRYLNRASAFGLGP